ncbi:leucine-rich repeat domain-containing protein, partial [bacterium]|nr:leucine-rich repeat domain-containing protein [bacterium]
LQDLSCNNNRLISLPHQIANLTNLHKDGFSCDKNPLQYVPKSLKKLEDERKFGYLWNKPPFDASLFMDSPPVPQPDENGILSIGHPDHVQWFFDEYRNNPDFKKQIQKAVKRIEYTDFFEELVVPMPILRMYPGESEPQYCLEFDSEWQVLAATLRFEIDGTFREEFKKTQNINFIGLGLTKIPPFVFQCRNIEKIFLERNQIKELPEKIALLEKLTFLGLGCNNLQQLPLALERLDKLRVITLDLNPFDHPYAQMPHLERLPDLEHISVDGELAQRLYGQCKCSGTRVRFRQLINQSF